MLLAFIIGKLNRMEEIFMRTVTETYNVYTYPELSEEAKEKVNQWYLDDPCRNDEFLEIYTENLQNIFSNSNLKMQSEEDLRQLLFLCPTGQMKQSAGTQTFQDD